MKNNFSIFFLIIFIFQITYLFSNEIEISSDIIEYNADEKTTTFKGNVNSKDNKNNRFFSNSLKYDKNKEFIETFGETKILTSNNYEILSSNVQFDNVKKIIFSNFRTKIIDKDNNNIEVENFKYSTETNIFFSKGKIKIKDVNNNIYNFSEIYIDEVKQTIIGSDVKAFLNNKDLSAKEENNPRFFANTIYSSNKINTFEKGIFTYCKDNGKCPPWVLKSSKIHHDVSKKTIYYDNVVLKIYDFPIFYSPKFSHPDPTVERRSGFLVPSLLSNNSLGAGINIPYFLDLGPDKDITITPKIYLNDNPVILTEYREANKKSFLILDTSFNQGYKKKNDKKSGGTRSHIFAKFNSNLIEEADKLTNLEINFQTTSNDTYLKVHDIDTTLVNKDKTVLENTINLTHQNKDFFFGFSPSYYEDTSKYGHLRDEYLLPLLIEKNLMVSERYGFLDLSSDLTLRNYDTNKYENFLINDFKWKSNSWLNKYGFENYFESIIKTVNYKTRNTDEYKNQKSNTEFNSAIGYFSKLNLFKKNTDNTSLFSLTPKFLIRYAPGHMRNIDTGRLKYDNLFKLKKVEQKDVLENGLSASIGLEFKENKINKSNVIGQEKITFSIGQVISQNENMDLPQSSSLDQRFSDIVGKTNYNLNSKLNFNYNFLIDQNYKQINYNELGINFITQKAKFNLSYLEESRHIGEQELINVGFDYKLNNFNELSFSTKRNLHTSSAEFYNLSYNYINDCLKAGIVYRREFYNDRDIEPENKLMFTISIIPFAEINSPKISR